MLRLKLLFIMLFMAVAHAGFSRIIVASGNGNWETNSTWVGNSKPQCGDTVIIGAGITVQVTTVLDFTSCTSPSRIEISGTLTFQTGKKLKLPCNSYIQVNSGGLITAGGGGGNSNYIEICTNIVWNAATGNLPGPVVLPATPLPVSLLYFTAKAGREEIALEWITAAEINNEKFILEKSYDAITFFTIETIPGSGTSSNLRQYACRDKNPVDGIQYYRLLQKDFDGRISVHKIVSIQWNDDKGISIHPNPTRGEMFVRIPDAFKKQLAHVKINMVNGKEVYASEIQFSESTENIPLANVTGILPPGTYVVNLIFQSRTFTRFMVIK